MKNEHTRLRRMKSELGITNKDIAVAGGKTEKGIKNATQSNMPISGMLCYSILVHEWHNGGRKGSFKDFIKENK